MTSLRKGKVNHYSQFIHNKVMADNQKSFEKCAAARAAGEHYDLNGDTFL
jgi:hypothetical protein